MSEDGSARAPVRRPGGRTARLRHRMLEAAAELIARDGIRGLRYEDVADLAGVNKTSVYRNWPDRTTLVSDALASFSADAAPLRDSGDIDADLVDFIEALAASLASPQGRALLTVVGSARDDPDLEAVVDEVFARRQATLRERVEKAIVVGELPPIEPYFLIEMLSGPVYLFLTRGDRAFTRADAERVVTIVLAGARATATESD